MSTQEKNLGQVCIQVHPGRAPALSISRLKEECEVVAKRTEGIRGIGVTEGEDDGPYLNIIFATEKPMDSWHKLRTALLESTEFGTHLKASCMCMCTGEDGWNGHLLLYHFDPKVPLDAGDA